MANFFKSLGDHKSLIAYQKAMCVYDGAVFFTRRFMKPGDRTTGQMEQAVRSVKQNIVEGNIDVLISTTIIETGLDIPNVNTIIIHDADKFGLSQLYVRGLAQRARAGDANSGGCRGGWAARNGNRESVGRGHGKWPAGGNHQGRYLRGDAGQPSDTLRYQEGFG